MSVSDSATALDPVTVSAGSTLGESFAAAGLTMTGPNAIVVARTDDGRLLDLTHMPDAELAVQPVPMSSPDGLNVLRHSAAHVMAQAVQDLFPESKLGMGPPIENGFYYDFGVEIPFSTEDLPRIEDRMKEIIKRGQRFSRRVYGSAAEALEELSNEPYKLDLIQDSGGIDGNELMEVGEGALTVYDNLDPKTGERCWSDLCRGPHLPSTKMIPAVKLLRTAAAYWRGSEKNPQLQRIYGTAWPTRDELKAHLARLEEAAKRDHRRIGEHLDLFAFSTEVGKGLPLWLPNGTIIRDELEGWARESERAYGYQRVVTPQLAKDDLYYLSGHLPYYAEDLYSPIDIEGETYYLRPMNCPHHHMVYQSRPKSYRELPYRIAEYGTVYRFERSGQLFGLMRTRGFTQNDAHIYCTFDQAREEFLTVMKMHEEYYTALGIEDFHMVLALRDPAKTDKYHDDEEMWRRAEEITRGAMDDSGIPYVEDIGGAAHYGPKVDFMIRTVGGKEYAASTNQVDLYTPSRYDLNYVASDGTKQPVVVIHRAPLGSHERFTSYLVEHFGGAFPVWLAPEQVVVIPVMPDLDDYAAEVNRVLLGEGFRSQADLSDGRLGAKVRTASKRWVPFIAVVGRREAEERSVTVRDRTGTETPMSLDDFVALMHDRIDTKSLIDAGHITKA